jgi:hypothetical protein
MFCSETNRKYMQGVRSMMTLRSCKYFQLLHTSICAISKLCFFAKDHFVAMGRQVMYAHLLPKCIIMCYIKGFWMIPKIFERPKIIRDYLFQAE